MEVVRQMEQTLRTRYIPKCHDGSPILMMSSLLARLIVVHFWLMAHYPFMSLEPGRNGKHGDLRATVPGAKAE